MEKQRGRVSSPYLMVPMATLVKRASLKERGDLFLLSQGITLCCLCQVQGEGGG